MRKIYTENDEIEIRLINYVGPYYDLQWRFKEPRKFLCFKIKNWWRRLCTYSNYVFDPADDPRDDYYWHNVYFNMGKKSNVQEYESVKAKVKTKKDLLDYFKVKESNGLYLEHLKKHREWEEELKDNVKKYV